MTEYKNSRTGSRFGQADVQRMIDAINNEGTGLTEWQQTFIDSVTKQWERFRSLSESQLNIVEDLYTNKVK